MIQSVLKTARILGRLVGFALSFIGIRHFRYLFYLVRREIATQLYRKSFKAFHHSSLLAPSIRLIKPQFISIGECSSVLSGCILECVVSQQSCPELNIGNHVSLGEYSHITCTRRVVIGNGVLTGRFVLITDNAHGGTAKKELVIAPASRTIVSKGEVVIGNNVWLGDKVTILPGIHIGDGAVIGANSVVTKNIPAYAVACGNPARIIK